MKYRAEIDGLRAFAVVPVVLYHANLDTFAGGYVGVDIFFVISGYLITRSLMDDIDRDAFSIAAFYERRIKRIYPALFAMLFATFAVALAILPPLDFFSYAKSLASTVLFASNVVFFREANYFDGSAELKPLLHTWSLAVEEQFYIVFPLLLAGLSRFSARSRSAAIAMLAIASLALSIWATSRAPVFNFYLPFTRAWELLLGSLLAIGAIKPLASARLREAAALAGLVLIILPVFLYAPDTPFPGLTALPPTIGTLMLIHSAQDTKVGALLRLRPLVYIGLISYSLYLWHWPVIVFTRFYQYQHLGLPSAIGTIIVSFVLGALSLRFVERPFRAKGRFSRRQIFIGAGLGSAALLLLAVSVLATGGMAFRNPQAARLTKAMAMELAQFNHASCLKLGGTLPGSTECLLGGGSAAKKPSVILWGDSHAAQLAPAFDAVARRDNILIQQITKAGCPPVQAARFEPYAALRRDCPAFNRAALDRILADPSITTVILAGRWDTLATGLVRAVAGDIDSAGESRRIASASLADTARRLNARGIRVVVIDQIPLPGFNPFVCTRAALFNGLDTGPCDRFDAAASGEVQRRISTSILSGVAAVGGATSLLDVRDALCSDRVCRTSVDGRLLYLDDVHLSRLGSDMVAERLRSVLAAPPATH